MPRVGARNPSNRAGAWVGKDELCAMCGGRRPSEGVPCDEEIAVGIGDVPSFSTASYRFTSLLHCLKGLVGRMMLAVERFGVLRQLGANTRLQA